MATDVVVPEVGEMGMDVTLVRWLKVAGDEVAIGDILFELDTDKTVVEVEAWTGGTLLEVMAVAGDTVSPRQVVARIGTRDELADGTATESTPGGDISEPHTTAGPASSSGGPAKDPSPSRIEEQAATRPADGGATRASPRARRLATEHAVDLSGVTGSGPDGLITERDVLDAAGISGGERG